MPNQWQIKRDSFDHQSVPALLRERWHGEPASLRLISQDYNIVYRFVAEGRAYYLRICHAVLHPLPKARQAMRFLRFLADNDAPVGKPAQSARGNYIELLPGGYYAAAQREAPGTAMSQHLLDLSVYEAWGEALGKLHAAARRFQPDPASAYQFPTVQRFWRNIAATVRQSSPALQRVYAELTDYMRSLPPRDYGLIHGDYRPGNVIWDGSVARAIDFDEPNYHWYIADVARALMELAGQARERRREFRDAFMAGYLSQHAIDAFWVAQLPAFVQHRALLMHMWDVQEGGAGGELARWALERLAW